MGGPRDAPAYLVAGPAEVERPTRGVGLTVGSRRGWSEPVGRWVFSMCDAERKRAEEAKGYEMVD